MNMKKAALVAVVATAAAFGYWITQAGNLQPPGAPAPTMKTLDEVQPRTPIHAFDLPLTISLPGSYYFTETINAGGNNITVTASRVTIDLMGFSLVGGGIIAGVGTQDITVQNGSVFDSGGASVDLSNASECRVAHLQLRRNAEGIKVGTDSTVIDCLVDGSNLLGASGIVAGNNSVIHGCTVNDIDSHGIEAGNNAVISNCSTEGNNGIGIRAGNGAVVLACSSHGENNDGINVGDGATVSDCSVTNSENAGISAGDGALVAGCSVRLNWFGISLGNHSKVVNSTSSSNSTTGVGIGNSSVASGNVIDGNDGGLVAGSGGRIEGNSLTNNVTGLDVSGTGNLIIKNSASGNSTADFSIVAGNSVGPIVNVAGAGDISGTPNSDHPWANFVY